jgi:hypothetical protein
MLQTILANLNDFAQAVPWDAATYGFLLSPLLLLVKKIKGIHNGELMVWLLLAGSLLAGFANYLTETQPGDPRVIAFNSFVTLIATQPVYKLLLKPAIAFFQAQVDKAVAFNEEVKSAAVPNGGITVSYSAPRQLEVTDFSQTV